MTRRGATFIQSDVARAIRASKQAGAHCVEIRPDGTIVVLITAPSVVPDVDDAKNALDEKAIIPL